MDNDLLTITQAAEYLGVTRQAIHVLTKRGYGKRSGAFGCSVVRSWMHIERFPSRMAVRRGQKSEPALRVR
jgi:hypothetical protein